MGTVIKILDIAYEYGYSTSCVDSVCETFMSVPVVYTITVVTFIVVFRKRNYSVWPSVEKLKGVLVYTFILTYAFLFSHFHVF